VLVPGSHRLPPDGEYREVGTAAFSEAVIRDLPPEALYRRANVLGEIHDGAFRVVTADRMRTIVDGQVRLGAGKDGGDEEYAVQFRSCSKDLAGVVLSYGETQGSLRDLRHVASHPVCVGPEFELAEPGWNASCGVFQTDATRYEPLPLKTARAVLDDLVVDFPFATAADRANYFGLLLTPILRPAIEEPVPMHLIGSPVERTGKTKLAEIVLGCTVLGHPTPAMQLGMREEEREKRIMAVLLAGQPVIHLDNLHDFVDSPALASLLTSTTYQGRELNHSRMLSVPNGLTVVASGNNVHATGELAKRTVPVILHPPVEAPETRQDYRHPLLRGYVQENRERAVGALLGLLRAWCDAGRPLGSVGFGGFERWAAVVGGIMRVAGYPEWLANLQEWRGGTDDFGDELRELVGFWETKWGREWVPASALFDLAEERELFGRITAKGSTDRGRRTSFGLKVLNAAENRVVGGWKVEITGRGSQRRARLNRV